MNNRIELILQDKDVIAGRVDPAIITDRRVFLEVSREDCDFNMKKALAALNVMSKSGWKIFTYESTSRDMGFVLEKAS